MCLDIWKLFDSLVKTTFEPPSPVYEKICNIIFYTWVCPLPPMGLPPPLQDVSKFTRFGTLTWF